MSDTHPTPLMCPKCHAPLEAEWSPRGRAVRWLGCTSCRWEIDFQKFRTAKRAYMRQRLLWIRAHPNGPTPEAPSPTNPWPWMDQFTRPRTATETQPDKEDGP